MKHHVREEENELFPKLKSSDMELEAVGQQLAQRKQQLESRMARGSHNGARGRRSSGGRGARDSAQATRGETGTDEQQRSRNAH